jgi:hypothetical protein
MLAYADACSRMLTYAHVCSRMLTYADECSRMLVYKQALLSTSSVLRLALEVARKHRFTAALLMLYCHFTDALLLLHLQVYERDRGRSVLLHALEVAPKHCFYCCFTAVFTAVFMLFSRCFTAALLLLY